MSLLAEIKKIKSDRKELRKFGISFCIAMCLLGSLLLWRGKSFYFVFYCIAPCSLLAAFVAPEVLKPLQKMLASLVIILGWLVTHVALGIAFYLIFTPMGIIARMCGKHFLDEKIDKKCTSYWIPKQKREHKPADYERQF
ncbi:MAG: hypothetical protein KKH94_13285 [Candidatus Omnitrophica bacterium]|nr:hypothetical protein [Candidatus Omnitrophota bacterium]